jgi:hypothetical protein
METLERLQNWFAQNCDGDWEHEYGITIFTLDNPGWGIKIDLSETQLDGKEMETEEIDDGDSDWYIIQIKDNCIIAHGDKYKLNLLISRTVDIIKDLQTSK